MMFLFIIFNIPFSGTCTDHLDKSCQNEGYQDPTDCSRCRCPDGLGGRYCTRVAPSGVNSPVKCGGEREAKKTTEFIESPGYSSNTDLYKRNMECNWKITVSF